MRGPEVNVAAAFATQLGTRKYGTASVACDLQASSIANHEGGEDGRTTNAERAGVAVEPKYRRRGKEEEERRS